jgi:hypothetical protein
LRCQVSHPYKSRGNVTVFVVFKECSCTRINNYYVYEIIISLLLGFMICEAGTNLVYICSTLNCCSLIDFLLLQVRRLMRCTFGHLCIWFATAAGYNL